MSEAEATMAATFVPVRSMHAVDFRQLYATLLRGWLDADPAAVLDGDFASLPLLR